MLICNVYIQLSGVTNSTNQSIYKKMINDSKDFTDRNQNMTMGYYSRHGHLIVHVSLGWLLIFWLQNQKHFRDS